MWRRQIGVLAAAFAAAATMSQVAYATTAQACGEQVIEAWSDGTLGPTYPVACYTWALGHLPPDVEGYSSAPDDIQRELLAAVRRRAAATHGVLGASIVRTRQPALTRLLPLTLAGAAVALTLLGAIARSRRRRS